MLLNSALSPMAVLALPSVLLKSANAPVPVLKPPVELLKSAPAPVAVFSCAVLARSVPAPAAVLKLPVVLQRNETNGCIERARCEAKQGVLPFCCIASGIAAVRQGNDRARLWQKRKADKDERENRDGLRSHFHRLNFRKNHADLSR